MGVEAERLREEQEALQRELAVLEEEKKKGDAEVEAHEHRLEEAKLAFESAKVNAKPKVDYEALKEEIRRSIQGRHGEICREIDDGWEAHLRYLEGNKADLEREMNEALIERKKLQDIKVQLRNNGVAEFQTYTPSSLGGTPRMPPSQISPISYSADNKQESEANRQESEANRQGSEALLAVNSPHTVPPTPEVNEA